MISSFTGKHSFLSNFYPCKIQFEDILYPSSEHAYVAAKTNDLSLRKEIAEVPTAGKVKRIGRKLELREDWDTIKLITMHKILENKFDPSRTDIPLHVWLLETAPHELVEGNTWGDTYWGQCPVGNGQNNLGKLLMSIRDDVTKRFHQ